MSPLESVSIFSWITSRTQTSWPRSAKQAAVTRPTQPAPMTPIGSRSVMRRENLAPENLGGSRYREHLLLRQRLQQRVRDPVDALPGPPRDESHSVAVVVEVELALA